MIAPHRKSTRLGALGFAAALALSLPVIAWAQYQQTPAPPTPRPGAQSEEDAKQEGAAPEADYSKDFRKKAAKVQEAVNEQKWTEVLEMLPELEAIEEPTRDDRKAIATWRLQATQGVGDQEAFAAAMESFLAEGFADTQSAAQLHRNLAAVYSQKQNREKTLEHFQKYVEATPNAQAEDFATLGALHLQANNCQDGVKYLTQAIDVSTKANQKPKESWYQTQDRCFVEMNDDAARLKNLEGLVTQYPNKEYYSRVAGLYNKQSQGDRIVMLNAYRLAVSDPQGGLSTVGEYISYADTALNAGSPGEAVRALERGMKDGVVPSVGSNQKTLTEAKTAVAQDKKALPNEAAAAAKDSKGEVDVKVALGFFSTGDFQQAVELSRRGISKGGVERLDDANLLLGAALMELGKRDEARAAFEAASNAAPENSPMKRIAGLWLARAGRTDTPAPTEPAPTAG
jgi:tetratricopeptide (TPR) repeat protein